jgi:hypothetical protein
LPVGKTRRYAAPSRGAATGREGVRLVDPITVVVTAVALGALVGLKDATSQAVKDAYAGPKALLTHQRVDVSAVERQPDSTACRTRCVRTSPSSPAPRKRSTSRWLPPPGR